MAPNNPMMYWVVRVNNPERDTLITLVKTQKYREAQAVFDKAKSPVCLYVLSPEKKRRLLRKK